MMPISFFQIYISFHGCGYEGCDKVHGDSGQSWSKLNDFITINSAYLKKKIQTANEVKGSNILI